MAAAVLHTFSEIVISFGVCAVDIVMITRDVVDVRRVLVTNTNRRTGM